MGGFHLKKKQKTVQCRHENLSKQAKLVVIATDIDREGETIARELLDLAGFRGQIKRLWLSALDEASIRKALPLSKTMKKHYRSTTPGLHVVEPIGLLV